MNPRAVDFETRPFVTPELLAADSVAAFKVVPTWVRMHSLTLPEGRGASPVCTMLVGGKFPLAVSVSVAGAALLFEIGRLGHRVVTNSNHAKPVPTVYARMSFRDAPGDMMTISRILYGAVDHEVIKQGHITSDLRSENLLTIPGGKPDKDARKTTMRHVERLASEREAGGTLPKGFDMPAYLANIDRLFAIVDREALGQDPIAAMPLIAGDEAAWPLSEMTSEETLGRLSNPAFAIAFALHRLPAYEVPEFLRDWQDRKPLKPWLDGIEHDRVA